MRLGGESTYTKKRPVCTKGSVDCMSNMERRYRGCQMSIESGRWGKFACNNSTEAVERRNSNILIFDVMRVEYPGTDGPWSGYMRVG